MSLEFHAPWSRSLKWVSGVAVLMLLGIFAAGFIMPPQFLMARIVMILLPVVALASALLFMVSGYVLTSSSLEVRRPFWNTSIPLRDLVSVSGDSEALSGSMRLFGNGGLFAFTGFFWNKRLGRYRAFGTDPARAVILKFKKRMVVVTPDDPYRFIVRVRTHLATTGYS
jgi:hypothetical protein